MWPARHASSSTYGQMLTDNSGDVPVSSQHGQENNNPVQECKQSRIPNWLFGSLTQSGVLMAEIQPSPLITAQMVFFFFSFPLLIYGPSAFFSGFHSSAHPLSLFCFLFPLLVFHRWKDSRRWQLCKTHFKWMLGRHNGEGIKDRHTNIHLTLFLGGGEGNLVLQTVK